MAEGFFKNQTDDNDTSPISGRVELVWGVTDVVVCDRKKCVRWPVSAGEDHTYLQSSGEAPELRHQPTSSL